MSLINNLIHLSEKLNKLMIVNNNKINYLIQILNQLHPSNKMIKPLFKFKKMIISLNFFKKTQMNYSKRIKFLILLIKIQIYI
jgi:hypothetical protein